MRKIAKIAFVILCTVAMSCGGPVVKEPSDVSMPVLFSAVPSDALAIVSGRTASGVLSYYDSTSTLRALNLGTLAQSPAVLSLNYYTSLIPVLVIDTGSADEDVNPELQPLSDRAEAEGFHTSVRILKDAQSRDGVRVLIICPSVTVLETVTRHIDESASIADVPLFRDACAAADGASTCMIFRCSAAARLLPPAFLSEQFSRRQVIDFIAGTAQWLVLAGASDKFRMIPISDGSGRGFSDFIAKLGNSSCRAGRILPASTEFLIDMPVSSVGSYRQAVEAYKDANVALASYRDTLKSLGRKFGKDPLAWENELNIREVAIAGTDSALVLLVRPARKPKAVQPGPNPYRRFIPALYGVAFSAPDEYVAPYDGWLVYGSQQDVRQFTAFQHEGIKIESDCKMICLTPEWTLNSTESGNTIEFR